MARTSDALVADTIRMIEKGETQIKLDQNLRDTVLLIGNTGAGKSTITNLLCKFDELEVVDAGDRLVIQDRDNRISKKETCIVSQTLYPDLFIDRVTNTAFYDLPGFCDTRDETFEIANACFMKKVADHAQRVKLLCVVNHSSFLTAESRTDFKDFLEHATNLIKKPNVFAQSIALVVTKVRGGPSSEKIIKGIAKFLEMTRRNLPNVMSDQSRRSSAENIIDALLTQDSTGRYTRLAYFSEPLETGPLKNSEEASKERDLIANILKNIVFINNSPDNFGLSISPGAYYLISQIGVKMNQGITETMKKISTKFGTEIEQRLERSESSEIGTHKKNQDTLEIIIKNLQKNYSDDRKEFYETFKKITAILGFDHLIRDEFKELESRDKNLAFLEDVGGDPFDAMTLHWTMPLQFFLESYRSALFKKSALFVDDIEDKIRRITQELDSNLEREIQKYENTQQNVLQLLETYTESLTTLNGDLARAKSINIFIQKTQSHLLSLAPKVSTSGLIQLKDDINFGTAPFNAWHWIKSFESLQMKLREKSALYSLQCANEEERLKQEEKSRQEREEQEKRMKEMQDLYQKQVQEQEEKNRVAKKEQEKQIKALKEDYKEQIQKQEEQIQKQKAESEKRMKKMEKEREEDRARMEREKEQWKELHQKQIQELEENNRKAKEEQEKQIKVMKKENKEQRKAQEEQMKREKEETEKKIKQMEDNMEKEKARMEREKEHWKNLQESQIKELKENNRLAMEAQKDQIKAMKDAYEEQRKSQQAQIEKDKADADRRIKKMEEDMNKEKASLKREIEQSKNSGSGGLGVLGDVLGAFVPGVGIINALAKK